MKSRNTISRRLFLRSVSIGPPTLRLMLGAEGARVAGVPENAVQISSEKFNPLDLSRFFTASSTNFGPRPAARGLSGDVVNDGLIRTPGGAQSFRGIPFMLGPGNVGEKTWVVLSDQKSAWATDVVTLPIGQRAGFVCLAAFCDWDPNETPPPGEDAVERVGQHLGDVILDYDDGSQTTFPIRRRFEVNAPTVPWGHLCYAAESHVQDAPSRLSDALGKGVWWGDLQSGVINNQYPWTPDGRMAATVWISAFQNPHADRPIKVLRLQAGSDDPLVICGITLFHGREHPLRYERLTLYRITLPEATRDDDERWKVEIDLGVVARTFFPEEFEPAAWLSSPAKGLGEHKKAIRAARHLFTEVTASPDATLALVDTRTGRRYEFALGRAASGQEIEARPPGARVEILEREKVWLQGTVLDKATGRPTPVRLAFRSKEGRYIPPYGHRTEINDGWFQDYGADLKMMDTSFAYIDGTFQAELPVGEVYLEMTKGFEYEAVRKKLQIAPGQRELNLDIPRFVDLRSQGWVTADTHVHFLSPSTAVLEGQAEGVNLISLLAAQWGDLFTNVGDIPYGPLVSSDAETMVQVSSENRQHILGHLGLVGGHGPPVYPMSASGPGESYLGDPLWCTLADWADAQRKREGLVVAVHFPYPTAELAADVALGKIDAVELYPHGKYFNTVRFLDWYRYLNCGYRLPAVGGTDKMGAYMPVGANRTYAYLGKEEFNFVNWAQAVRKGNTFMTTGPLLIFQADGHTPGDEITLGAGGGTVEVRVEAKSFVPFHRLEVVLNGKVVASREDEAGTREMTLSDKVQAPGPGWVAARCMSRWGPTTGWMVGGVQAHTSPVYMRVPGQELFSAPAVAYMLTLIDGAQTWVENLATRADPVEFERIRKILAEAHDRLHRRMHDHGTDQ